MKGITLETATVVVLSLDGTLVYVESVEPTHASVVALPDQPAERADDRVFKPGCVGSKKISPFSTADKVIPVPDLSERNKLFIGTYEQLRTQHGANHVDRTPEELAAHEAANAGPVVKAKKTRATPEEKEAAKAAKKASKGGPRYLQRCVTCGEQPGHPNHPTVHPFEASPPPVVLCAACDQPADAAHHAEGDTFTHRFMGGKPMKVQREPRAPSEPKVKTPKCAPSSGPFVWIGSDDRLEMLAAVNPKYKSTNSGAAIVAVFRDAGEAGADISAVMLVLSKHERWAAVPVERVQVAVGQLLGGKLIAVK